MKVSNKKMTDDALRQVAAHLAWGDELPEDLEVSNDVKRLLDAVEDTVTNQSGGHGISNVFSNMFGVLNQAVDAASEKYHVVRDTVKDQINKPSATEIRLSALEERVAKLEGERQ